MVKLLANHVNQMSSTDHMFCASLRASCFRTIDVRGQISDQMMNWIPHDPNDL